MPTYRVQWPVFHNGKRRMPNETIDVSEAAGQRLASFGAVIDPSALPSSPTQTIPAGTSSPGTTHQGPAVPQPIGSGAKAAATSKPEAKKK